MKATTHLHLPYGQVTAKSTKTASKSLWQEFINYAEKQQPKSMLWMAIGLLGHGTAFTIATIATVVLTGNIFALFMIAICAMVAVLIVNLAAMPTKVTIPVFFISLLVDVVVIISALLLQ